MHCNFMLLSMNICRDWLKNADIDWDRVTEESSIDLTSNILDSVGVTVEVNYKDGKDEERHTCREQIPCIISADFVTLGIPLRKFANTVNKTSETMMLLFNDAVDDDDLGRSILYDFKPAHRYVLSDIMAEYNNDH